MDEQQLPGAGTGEQDEPATGEDLPPVTMSGSLSAPPPGVRFE